MLETYLKSRLKEKEILLMTHIVMGYPTFDACHDIIDQMVAQGVPFAREYGGLLDNRSFGGAQVSRTFYARGQTGQQLLLGCYSALMRQVAAGKVQLFPRREMLELVVHEVPELVT